MSESCKNIIVGLSGGVDSSVAALKLQARGHTEGLFMKNWEEDDTPEHCAAATDLKDAESVAATLGMRLRHVNFSAEYWDRVFAHFLVEYRAGRTPNPDVLCNKEIKFRAFLDHALALGADHIATGHYARRDRVDGRYRLLRGQDRNKDQSYFLYTLDQHQLRHTLFPIGDLTKPEVRHIAAAHHLVTHDKRDSTGICFIGKRRFRDFLSRYLPARRGDICTPEGRRIGEHDGLIYSTLGQRQGLGIGGVKGCPEAPWFVAAKELESNTLIAVQGHDHPLLLSCGLSAGRLEWIAGEPPALPLRCSAKTRYRQTDQACTIEELKSDGLCRVMFEQPQRAVTPGQSVVFYDGEECLGGGIIETAF